MLKKCSLEKVLNIMFKAVMVLILLIYTFCILKMNTAYNFMIYPFVSVVALVLFSFVIAKKFGGNDRVNIVFLAVASILLLSLWNYFYQSYPTSDYEVIWNGAHDMLNGTFYERASDKSDYFYFYNFQIGYTFYISLLLKIFGDSLLVIKISKIIVITLTDIVIYKIVRTRYDSKIALFSSLIYVFYPHIFVGSGIINNQHEGIFLVCLSIYFFLKFKSMLKYVVIPIILVVANILRPTEVIVVIAFVLVCIFYAILNKDIKSFIGAVLILLIYYSVYMLINKMFIMAEITPIGISGGNLWFKLLLGLTENGLTKTASTSAEKTNYYYDLLYYNFDYEKYTEAAKAYVFEILKKPNNIIRYVGEKYLKYAGNIDNQCWNSGAELNDTSPILITYIDFSGLLIYLFTIASSIINLLKNKCLIKDRFLMIGSVIFIGFALIYVFIETQTRYRFEQYCMLALIGMPFIYDLFNKGTDIILRKLKKLKKLS